MAACAVGRGHGAWSPGKAGGGQGWRSVGGLSEMHEHAACSGSPGVTVDHGVGGVAA